MAMHLFLMLASPWSYLRFYLYLQCNGSAKRLNCYVVSNKHKGTILTKDGCRGVEGSGQLIYEKIEPEKRLK